MLPALKFTMAEEPAAARNPYVALDFDDGGMSVVRLKPLGAGGGGGESSASSAKGEPSIHMDEVSHSLDVLLPSGRHQHFDYMAPGSVLSDSHDQQRVWDAFMPQRVEAFLEGVNVNIMAYGQTGSGKTHTMFGPPGIMQGAGDRRFGTELNPDYGLFPRGLLDISRRVKELNSSGDGGKKYILTCSCVELGMVGMVDMFVSSDISFTDLMMDVSSERRGEEKSYERAANSEVRS